MGSSIHEDGVGLLMKKHMAKFMGAYKKLFMLRKIFGNINDIISLKILVKAADTYQRGKNKDHIQTADDFKRVSGLMFVDQVLSLFLDIHRLNPSYIF